MCDYSLHAVRSRPAKVGDRLVSTKFPMTVTRGLTDPAYRGVAVCLLPGTELVYSGRTVKRNWLQRMHDRLMLVGRYVGKSGARVTFRHLAVNNPAVHHDAIEFVDGTTVLLNDLAVGQAFTVLQLPVTTAKSEVKHIQISTGDRPAGRPMPHPRPAAL